MRIRVATFFYPHDGTGRDPAEVSCHWPYNSHGVELRDAEGVIVSVQEYPPRDFLPAAGGEPWIQ